MAFENVGVKAIIEGMSTFRRDAESFNRDISSMGDHAKNLASSSLSPVTSALGTFGSALGNIGQIVTGIVSSQILFRVADGIGQIAKTALEASAEFQTLRVQIEGLIALQIADQFAANNMISQSFKTLRQLTASESEELTLLTLKSSDLHSQMEKLDRKIANDLIPRFGESSAEVNLAQNQLTRYGLELSETDKRITELNAANGAYITVTKLVEGQTLNMTEAQRQAVGPANQLLRWIEDFGIKTPFTIMQLAELSRNFLSIGMGVPETQRLTEALAALGAGLGLTPPLLDRIVANITQTSRAMKITERDIREFGNAGVPVNRVLDKMAKQLGITRDEALEFAKSGEAGVKAFVEGIQLVAEEDFPNALDRLSKTWAVAASNIKDLVESVLGKEVLGPILAQFGEIVGGLIDQALTMRSEFTKIGETIGVAFRAILPNVETLLVSLSKLTASLLGLFGIDLSEFDPSQTIAKLGLAAIQVLNDLTRLSDWINQNVIPVLNGLKQWFEDNVPKIQAALQPLLDALGGMATTLEKDAPKIVAALNLMFSGLQTTISTFGPEIIENVSEIVNSLTAIWEKHGTTILGVMVLAFNSIATAVGTSVTFITEVLSGLFVALEGVFDIGSLLLQGKLTEASFKWIEVFTTFGLEMKNAAFGLFSDLLGIFGLSLADLVATWTANLNLLAIIVAEVFMRIYVIATQEIPKFVNFVVGKIGELTDHLRDLIGEFSDIAQSWVMGMVGGILLKASVLIEAGVGVVRDAVKAIRRELDISSPSQVAAELIGEPFSAGIAEGILKGAGLIQSAASAVSIGAVRGAMPVAAVGSSSVTNVTNNNFDVNANYNQTQSPVTLRMDLESLLVTST